MSHGCPALVVNCMDYRLQPSFFQLLAEIGLSAGSFDLVSVAGSAKDLLSSLAGESRFLLKQIELSKSLHGITEVVIVLHDDCGAYGIPDPEQEHQTQISDLALIVGLIKQRFPELDVKSYIIKGVAQGDLRLEKCD